MVTRVHSIYVHLYIYNSYRNDIITRSFWINIWTFLKYNSFDAKFYTIWNIEFILSRTRYFKSLVSCLRKLNCQNIHHQICLKHLNMLFLAIKLISIHREKYQNSLVLNFEHFLISVHRDLLLKELPPAALLTDWSYTATIKERETTRKKLDRLNLLLFSKQITNRHASDSLSVLIH